MTKELSEIILNQLMKKVNKLFLTMEKTLSWICTRTTSRYGK